MTVSNSKNDAITMPGKEKQVNPEVPGRSEAGQQAPGQASPEKKATSQEGEIRDPDKNLGR